MKSLYKYITLLLFSGVIIPLYHIGNLQAPVIKTTQIIDFKFPVTDNSTNYGSVMHDVAAKLLPVIKYF